MESRLVDGGPSRVTSLYAEVIGRELGGGRRLRWVLRDASEWALEGMVSGNELPDPSGTQDLDDCLFAISLKRGLLDEKFRNANRVLANGAAGSTRSEVARLKHFLDVYQAVLHHTERYDGTGLPDRLSGELIPDASRILAVAIGWTSLTTRESARLSHGQAIDRLIPLAGWQFDPAIVAAARRIVTKQGLDGAGVPCLPQLESKWLRRTPRRRPGFARELPEIPVRTELVERMRRRNPR